MLCPVQLDDKPCFCAVEIGDIAADGLLALEARGASAQILIPQLILPWRHVFAKLPRQWDILFIIVEHGGFPFLHCGYGRFSPPPPAGGAPSQRGLKDLPLRGRWREAPEGENLPAGCRFPPAHYTSALASSSVSRIFSSAAVKPRRTKLCTVTARAKWKGRQKFSTSLGIVRSKMTASGNRAA